MPSRKQRRRRAKERRHEYEYVYVDEEGREVEVDEVEEPAPAPRSAARDGKPTQRARGGRAQRKIEPPSWRRVGRRALLLGPVLFLLMFLLKPKGSSSMAIAAQALFFLLIFLPFSYLMDSMLYRSYLKRTGQAPPPRAPGRRPKEPKPKT
jgi:hypothetical protein